MEFDQKLIKPQFEVRIFCRDRILGVEGLGFPGFSFTLHFHFMRALTHTYYKICQVCLNVKEFFQQM